MYKLVSTVVFSVLFTGCVTVGKVGYIVPAENDSKEFSEEVVGEKCGTIVIGILDDVSSNLKSRGNTSNKDVALVFDQSAFSGCMQVRKLK